jgi:ubiquitin-like protein Pup
MPEREQKKKPAPKERAAETEEVDAAPGKQAEALKEELDDLLDEIDSVLESNAEDFVRSYVQKGGE